MLASLAAYELLHQTRQEETGEGGAAAAAAAAAAPQRGGAGRGGSVSSELQLAAYKRAFRKASLRWHPDKFEGRFGGVLCAESVESVGSVGRLGDDDGGVAGETHADAIRRRVRAISQQINDSWSSLVK